MSLCADRPGRLAAGRRLLLTVLVISGGCLAPLYAGGAQESIYEVFYSTGLDPAEAYAVNDLVLRKENMSLTFERGTVILMKAIDDEVTGLAFVGQGVARMTPPNRSERYMLERQYGAPVLNEPFEEAIIRFSDDTEDLVRQEGRRLEKPPEVLDRAGGIFSDRNSWLDGRRNFNLESRYLELRQSNLKGLDFFVAEFHSEEHGWVTYYHDPQSYIENFLFTSRSLGSKNRRYFVPWTAWHKAADYGPKGHYLQNPAVDGPRLMRIKHQEMEINLEDTKTVQWKARLLIEPRIDGLRGLLFDQVNNARRSSRWDDDSFNPVHVLSVRNDRGDPIPFSHKKDQLLITMPEPLPAGEPITVVVQGTAEVIYQLTAESFGFLQAAWYPQYGFLGGRSSFRWTVRVPRPFLISGSGRFVRQFEDKETRQNGIEITEDEPIHFPWVIFGRFRMAEEQYIREASKKPLRMTIHSFPTMSVPITDQDLLERIGASTPFILNLKAPMRKIDAFFEEGKEVLKLYEHLYGPYPFEELHIAQMAPFLGYGQAPQGFVQLTGEAFMSQAQLESDFFHGFFAHEIAHQWWAHQIGWASPNDEWLSESFAEYASGIFVNEFQGPKRFQRTLAEWRRKAKYSDQEAPIATANFLSGPTGGRHRNNLLYAKGPYVLHMLRVQLDDAKYTEVMRSVQTKYQHHDISTEQLVREINRVTGADYTYFFDQWFWDVGVPKFRYSWRVKKQERGKFLVTVNVTQEDTDHVKRVLMPIYLHFKDKTIPQYRPVVEAEQTIQFLIDEKPRDVTLDDERTLLAEFEKLR